jgi:hypothetical protein
MADKPLAQWTFDELVARNRETVTAAILKGDLAEAVWQAAELAARWRREKDAGEGAVGSDDKLALAVAALQKINTTVYAEGAPLGSENYFTVRELATGALKAVGAPVA